jgi:hypothetical protein
MADAADSKSADRKVVKVRLLSPARYLWHFSKICLLQGFFGDFAAKLCNGVQQKPVFWAFIGYTG